MSAQDVPRVPPGAVCYRKGHGTIPATHMIVRGSYYIAACDDCAQARPEADGQDGAAELPFKGPVTLTLTADEANLIYRALLEAAVWRQDRCDETRDDLAFAEWYGEIVADLAERGDEDQDQEPEPDDYDPGPEVDDEGGMSEYRHHEPEPWS